MINQSQDCREETGIGGTVNFKPNGSVTGSEFKYITFVRKSMIRFFLISTIIRSVFLLGLAGIVTFKLSQNVYAQTPPEPGPPADCKEMISLWRHTYGHPGGQTKPITWSRFVEHKPTSAPDGCVVAKGVIENTPSVATDEHDGGYHFLLTPDTGYKNLLTTSILKV